MVTAAGSFVSEQTLLQFAKSVGLSAAVGTDGFVQISSDQCAPCLTWRAVGMEDGQRYFPTGVLLKALALSKDHSLTVTGHPSPVLHTRDSDYVLDKGTGLEIYKNLAFTLLEQLGTARQTDIGGVARYTHRISTRLPAGEVVMLVTQRGQQYTADYAKVAAGGIVTIKSNSQRILFKSTLADINKPSHNGMSGALLVKASNVPLDNLKSGIFLPTQSASDAR